MRSGNWKSHRVAASPLLTILSPHSRVATRSARCSDGSAARRRRLSDIGQRRNLIRCRGESKDRGHARTAAVDSVGPEAARCPTRADRNATSRFESRGGCAARYGNRDPDPGRYMDTWFNTSPTAMRRIGSVADFIPDRPACLTTPVCVGRDDLRERSNRFRSALRAFGRSHHTIINWCSAARRLGRWFEIHRRDSTPRMTS